MNEQRNRTAAAALAGLLCATPLQAFPLFMLDTGAYSEPVVVVEYYNPSSDHYFVTALREEIDALDVGVIAGWARTSQNEAFFAFDEPVRMRYVRATQAEAKPVCRFFIAPASHFLSVSKDECDAVAAAHPEFTLETSAAFYAWAPTATGECPQPYAKIGGFGFQPIYRLWNGRSDTNHRFTANKALRDAMVGQGWVSEGYGDDGVAMCAPRWSVN